MNRSIVLEEAGKKQRLFLRQKSLKKIQFFLYKVRVLGAIDESWREDAGGNLQEV